jgi:hypothetical protein
MRTARVRIRKSRVRRVSWCRMRDRVVMADPNRASNSAAPCAATSLVSEQWTGRCYQQCRYAEYCKKLGYPHHHALLIRGRLGLTMFPLSFKIGALFHANDLSLLLALCATFRCRARRLISFRGHFPSRQPALNPSKMAQSRHRFVVWRLSSKIVERKPHQL